MTGGSTKLFYAAIGLLIRASRLTEDVVGKDALFFCFVFFGLVHAMERGF